MSESDIQRIARHLTNYHRWAMYTVQFVIFVVAGVLAFLLRFRLQPTFAIPAQPSGWTLRLGAGQNPRLSLPQAGSRVVAICLPFAMWCDFATANLVGAVLSGLALLWFGPKGFPRSIYFLDFLLCFGMTAGARMAVRLAVDFSRLPNLKTTKRTLIYGAGDAGVTLLREIRRNSSLAYQVLGFIDDDAFKTGRRIHQAPVLGSGSDLSSIVKDHEVEMILIALPSATGLEMTRILNQCSDAGVAYKTVPGLAEVIESGGLASQIRDVAVEDLLGRAPVRLDEQRIRGALEGQLVLVTGAAGSIGSELCRQIARFHPAGIVGFEIAESPLFEIDREMRRTFPDVPFFPEIGSTQNRARLDEVLRQYRPSVIYHAAAYKHVPLMETHIFEAIENNVFGTYNVAVAAADYGVDDFVMISSDKGALSGFCSIISCALLECLHRGTGADSMVVLTAVPAALPPARESVIVPRSGSSRRLCCVMVMALE